MFSEPYDSASTVLLGDGIDASKATLDEMLGAIEKIDKANQEGQFRRFTGNDYTTDLAKGNVGVVARPTPATSCSSRATTRTCASPTSRRATSPSTTT